MTRRDWKGWMPIINQQTRAQEVLEVPRSAMAHIDRHLELHGTCFGWIASAIRQDGHAKGTVQILFRNLFNDIPSLPEPLSVVDYMHKIWRLPLPAPTLNDTKRGQTEFKEDGKTVIPRVSHGGVR